MNEEVVKVKNLSKDFDNFRAVDNISFEVKATEIFGFLGPNGAKIVGVYFPANTLAFDYGHRSKGCF